MEFEMGYWDYFSRGLLQSFSWKDGYDNALLRDVPGESYLLGVFSNSLLAVLITFLVFYGLNIAKLKAGSWKALISKEYQKNPVKSVLVLGFGLPITILVLVFHEVHRPIEALHVYEYFKEQNVHADIVRLIDIDIHTTTGRYGRKIFSNLIFVVETKEGTRKVNISDATQYEAEFLKENLETPTNISVHVNSKGEIVFVH